MCEVIPTGALIAILIMFVLGVFLGWCMGFLYGKEKKNVRNRM
jgi:hypothetical protein